MILTEDIIKGLPLSTIPENYDGVDEITEQIIQEFNAACDKFDTENENQSDNTERVIATGQD